MKSRSSRRPAVFNLAALALALAAALAAGAMYLATSVPQLAQAAPGAAQTSHGPTWTSYFYPQRVGLVCHETVQSSTFTGTETLTVASVTKTRQGVNIVVTEASSTQVAGRDVPTNAALHYTLTNDGRQIATPSNNLVSGIAVHTTGNTTFPPVAQLLAGQSVTNRVTESIPLTPGSAPALKQLLIPGQTALKMVVTITNTGRRVRTLTVPLGRFHNVLKLSASIKTFKVTNAQPGVQKELDSALRAQLRPLLTSSTWFAPNFGPIQFANNGATTVMTGCDS